MASVAASLPSNIPDDVNGEEELHKAARDGDFERVKIFVYPRWDINFQDKNGMTALMKAAENGHAAIMAYMILKGKAKIDLVSSWGTTALCRAARAGKIDSVKCLLELGADKELSAKGGWTPLLLATMAGHKEIVEVLIDGGVNIEARNTNGETAVILAAKHYKLEILQLLLNKGADLEARDNTKHNALMSAAKEGHMEVVAWLRNWINDHKVKDENLESKKIEVAVASKALSSWKATVTS